MSLSHRLVGLSALVGLLGVAACQSQPSGAGQLAAEVHVELLGSFYWLPPLGAGGDIDSPFNKDAKPTLAIDQIDPNTLAVIKNVAVIATATGKEKGKDQDRVLRVDGKAFHFNWHSKDYGATSGYYRLTVQLGGASVGTLVIQLGQGDDGDHGDHGGGGQGDHGDHGTGQKVIPFFDGGDTIPVKFFLGFCALGCPIDACHIPGTCDPKDGSCSPAIPLPVGTVCGGDKCGGASTCDANGVCQPGTPTVIDTSNPCVVGTCDPATGNVTYTNAAAGTTCGKGGCATSTCDGNGACVVRSTHCLALDACHVAGTCDPSTGLCSNPLAAVGTTCGGDLCAGLATCDASGVCQPGTPATIDHSNPCVVGSCDPVKGVTYTDAPSGTSCGAGNKCAGGGTCDGMGTCILAAPVVCNAIDACHVAGTCDPNTGACTNPPAPAGTVCGGNKCVGIATCDGGGTCVAGTPETLPTPPGPCFTAVCDPTNGAVNFVPLPSGSGCGGNACTGIGTCNPSGVCVFGPPLNVNDNNPCTMDSCDPSTGMAVHTPVANGSACSTGNLCNVGESCQAGVCTASSHVTCTALDACHVAGTCDPASGACSNPTATDGTSCATNNPCQASAVCASGVCSITNAIDGTSCGAGHVCGAGACKAGCYIAGTLYAPSAANPTNACQQCQPSVSTTSWVTFADGTSCGFAMICASGTCSTACLINGQIVQGGVGDPNNACQTCQPAHSTSAWTPLPSGIACENGGTCDATGTCVCPTHQSFCAGTCINLLSDNGNCGACGNVCTGATVCQGGVCSTPVVPMPSNRGFAAAATWPGGPVLVMGGFSSTDGSFTNPVATVNAYDPVANSWSTSVPSMSQARGGLVAATSLTTPPRVYAIGGLNGSNYLNTVQYYDTSTGTWHNVAPMPTPRAFMAAVTGPDGLIYVLGGTNMNGPLNTVEILNPATNTWSTGVSTGFTARQYLAAAVGTDGRIYAMGGLDAGQNHLAVNEAYNPATQTWSMATPLAFPRIEHGGSAGSDGRIYLMGGITVSSEITNRVDAYDLSSWNAAAGMTYPRTGPAVVGGTYGGQANARIYVIGGMSTSGATNYLEVYVPAGDVWLH